MVTNDLGACEWFVWDLRRSGLIDRGQLDQIVSEFLKRNPRAEAPALAEYMIQQGLITPFQAERVLAQKSQGLVLGPYVLLDTIGQGSMGQVYKASSKNDSQLYAVKVLPRRSMWNVRLAKRQVRSFGQFSHPAVVPFVDVGTAGGLHYLVWPMVEGQTLEAMVQQHGRLSAEQTALIGTMIAQGLSICHQNSIFHGLLKPSNVMIGSDNQARILDFGIGSLLVENEGESLVDTMSTANTLTSGLDCAAPESIMDPTNRTPAGDQYSLGCTLYYCLTGQFPFPEGSAVEKMMAHQTKEPTPIRELVPDCPDGLAAVVSRLMAKNPQDRYASAEEVVEALEPYLGELAHNVPTASAMTPAPMAGLGARPNRASAGFASGGGLPTGFRPSSTPPGRSNPFPQAPTPSQPVPPAFGPGINPSYRGSSQTPIPPAAAGPAAFGPGRSPASALPSRDSFRLPDAPEVPLTPAASTPPLDATHRSSTAWLNHTDDDQKKAGSPLVTVAIAVLLTALVFVGAYLLLNMNR